MRRRGLHFTLARNALSLVDGVEKCKSFHGKHHSCISYACEAFARIYLAKHGFESSLCAAKRTRPSRRRRLRECSAENRRAYREHETKNERRRSRAVDHFEDMPEHRKWHGRRTWHEGTSPKARPAGAVTAGTTGGITAGTIGAIPAGTNGTTKARPTHGAMTA